MTWPEKLMTQMRPNWRQEVQTELAAGLPGLGAADPRAAPGPPTRLPAHLPGMHPTVRSAEWASVAAVRGHRSAARRNSRRGAGSKPAAVA